MSRYETAVAAIGGETDGIVVSDRVVGAGLDLRDLEPLRRRGVLVPIGRGVDRLRDHPWTWRSQLRAGLAIAGPGAAAGLRSAGRLHRYHAYRDTKAVEVVVPRGSDHRTSVGRLVETRWLPDDHVTEVDGFPVTTMARTFFDLCGDPDHGLGLTHPYHERRMAQVYNDALARRGMTFTQEAAVLAVLAKRGRRGTRLVRELLLRFGQNHVPTWSDTETLFLELVHAYGLNEPEKQAVITDDRGEFIGTVDFLWRRTAQVVEVDSSWHDGPLDELADAARDARLVAAGYTVTRYRYGDLVRRPAAVARELAAATTPIGG